MNQDNNLERAADWLFSHMDDPDSDHEMTDVNNEGGAGFFSDVAELPGNYQLKAFITHLGAGTHSGHYVCNVKKEGHWVYYNDAKVARTTEPPIGKGYMYFLRKVGTEEN